MTTHIIVASCYFLALGSSFVEGINWNGNNWALGCDFVNNDLANARVKGEECGGLCSRTSGCTHFAWTTFQQGTCWMKRGDVCQSNAVDTGDNSMVCGVIIPASRCSDGGGGVGKKLFNVLATRHVNGGGDACALPKVNYNVWDPFALGNINELDYLKFDSDLCGHILNIDCGHGPLNIIVTNSNFGGGLDLYSTSTWPKATGNQPPGQARCSVQLTDMNPVSGGNNQCFYKPGTGSNNPFFRNIGLLNTGAKIVTGATRGGREGEHRGDNFYYAFDGQGQPMDANEQVTFNFNDGSSHTVRFADCRDVGAEQLWT